MKKILLLIGLIATLHCNSQQIELELFASGIPNPVNIQNADDSRLFVLNQNGTIIIVNTDGTVNTKPFLDIKNKVHHAGDERGLLGLAFHPDYVSNGYFYVNYVNNNSETVISRFTKSSTNDDLADENSELLLLTLSQPYANHNGGELVFGKEGYLFIALGDGGSGGDPENRAQDLESLFGKILRIDVDQPQNGKSYGIPKDNPYAESTVNRKEIWAYGLRNPWCFSIDKVTNEMWIADVGQSKIEEINNVSATVAPINYGWRCYEGTEPYNPGSCPDPENIKFPISQYTHNSSGLSKCSITGGFRYRGVLQPNLFGIYFFADFCSGEIGMLKEEEEEEGKEESTWLMTFSEVFEGHRWTTFGEDVNGELYIADINSGALYKIKDVSLNLSKNKISKIRLYPNPAKDKIMIDFGTLKSQHPKIDIYNLQGQRINTMSIFEDNLYAIPTKHLSKGVYFMEIHLADGQQSTRKFVKN